MKCVQCGIEMGKATRKTCSKECLLKRISQNSSKVNQQHRTNNLVFGKKEKKLRVRYDDVMEKREIESLLNEYR